jgi:hypothetical protein
MDHDRGDGHGDSPVTRMWRWVAARPFLSALVVVVCVAVPGYWRQEQAIDEAHDAADSARRATDRLEELVAQRELDRLERRRELCDRDVADRNDARAMWLFVLDDLIDPPTDQSLKARVALDEILPVLECGPDSVPAPVND